MLGKSWNFQWKYWNSNGNSNPLVLLSLCISINFMKNYIITVKNWEKCNFLMCMSKKKCNFTSAKTNKKCNTNMLYRKISLKKNRLLKDRGLHDGWLQCWLDCSFLNLKTVAVSKLLRFIVILMDDFEFRFHKKNHWLEPSYCSWYRYQPCLHYKKAQDLVSLRRRISE